MFAAVHLRGNERAYYVTVSTYLITLFPAFIPFYLSLAHSFFALDPFHRGYSLGWRLSIS